MLARGLIEFIVGAMVGGGMFLYSPNSNIESVVFRDFGVLAAMGSHFVFKQPRAGIS